MTPSTVSSLALEEYRALDPRATFADVADAVTTSVEVDVATARRIVPCCPHPSPRDTIRALDRRGVFWTRATPDGVMVRRFWSAPASPDDPHTGIVVSLHALDRYRGHHPEAEMADVEAAVAAGNEVDPDVVWRVLQRRKQSQSGEVYRLAPDGAGLFVLAPKGTGFIVPTYLRLGETQRQIMEPIKPPAVLAGEVLAALARGGGVPEILIRRLAMGVLRERPGEAK